MSKCKLVIQIVLILISTPSISQIDSSRRINPADIKTQGEQEEYWAQEIFDKKYEAQLFDRYKRPIILLNETAFKYDETVIIAHVIEKEYQTVFEKGILYPAIFAGYNDGRILELPQVPDSVKSKQLYSFTKKDSLFVGIMQSLAFLNPSDKVMRFKLYLSRPGLMNPSMYVFELTNDTATKTTSLVSFINGARLSFFRFVSILL
jgi:hypothetical protein